MKLKLRKWAAIGAGAVVLAYLGTVTATEVRNVASWQADGLWLVVFAVICGALVFVGTNGNLWSIVVAALLATLIVAVLGFYIHWMFLGKYFTVLELAISNIVIVKVLPQSAVVFAITALMGLVGGAAVALFFPDHYPL